MQIKDLPEELRELVRQNQIAQGNDGNFEGDLQYGRSSKNFDWDRSPQGDSFWRGIKGGRNMEDSPHYPAKKIINHFKFF